MIFSLCEPMACRNALRASPKLTVSSTVVAAGGGRAGAAPARSRVSLCELYLLRRRDARRRFVLVCCRSRLVRCGGPRVGGCRPLVIASVFRGGIFVAAPNVLVLLCLLSLLLLLLLLLQKLLLLLLLFFLLKVDIGQVLVAFLTQSVL